MQLARTSEDLLRVVYVYLVQVHSISLSNILQRRTRGAVLRLLLRLRLQLLLRLLLWLL